MVSEPHVPPALLRELWLVSLGPGNMGWSSSSQWVSGVEMRASPTEPRNWLMVTIFGHRSDFPWGVPEIWGWRYMVQQDQAIAETEV